MGNCCGSSSNQEIIQQHNNIPPEEEEKRCITEDETDDDDEDDDEDDDDDEQVETITSPATTTEASTPFLATPVNAPETTTTIMLPLVDPRLVSLLDFFRQLHVRREAIFNNIIPLHRKDFQLIFGQMKSVEQLHNNESKRSLRQRSMSFGDADALELDRFKVKPIESGGLQPPKGGQGGSKPPGSK